MKQTIHILATIALLLCSLTSSAHDFVVNGIYYRCNNNDLTDPTVAVTYMGSSSKAYKNEYAGHVSIPSTITRRGKTYRVTEINAGAFEDCDKLTSICIPSSVTNIGYFAFYECINLTAVYISSIEAWCKTKIGSNPLHYAHKLYLNGKLVTKLIIPESVTSIGVEVFAGCSSLTSITIPESVAEIGNFTFSGCTSLKEVIIEDGGATLSLGYEDRSISKIGAGLFYDCPLETVYLGRNLSYLSGEMYGFSPFYKKETLKSLTVGDGVTEIGEYTFEGCKFTSVKCPDRFLDMFEIYAEVGDFVFREGSTPRLVKYNGNSQEIVLPEDFKGKKYAIDEAAFSGLQNFSIVIPEGVAKIESGLFEACGSRLTSVTIPNSVTEIGEDAFKGCSGLRFIVVPEGVTKIGNYAFSGCSSLTAINIPEGVTSIGDEAFYKCNHLTSVTISENSRLTSIGSSAFEGCSGLSLISIPKSVRMIGSSAFNGCSKLTSITIPEGVTSIGNNAFSYCSSLSSITIPEDVAEIGVSAFYKCDHLNSVTIPENSRLASIGDSAFEGCSGLSLIPIPSGVTKIGSSAFKGCSSLSSITIPEGVTRIGNSAFAGCRYFTFITIPVSVTLIGNNAFSDCSSLKSIIFSEKSRLASIEDSSFKGCSSLTSITIPKGVTKIGNSAFTGCSSLKEVIFEDGSMTLSLGYSYNSESEAYYSIFYDSPLESVYLGRKLNYVTYSSPPFSKKNKLSSVTIGKMVTSINLYEFLGCKNLTKVIAPKSLKETIKVNKGKIFYGCDSLRKITYVK